MDNSPIPGFVTRRQASELCQRSERTLQRYWSRAIELQDSEVLKHLKLRTEDGDLTDGAEVTKQLIDDLKKSSKNPTWYVHTTWAEKTYRPRDDSKPATTKTEPTKQSKPSDVPSVDTEVTALLKDRIERLEQDKQDLREELKIKNEQIGQASERDKETHVLMRDLHELLRDMQQRLPSPAQDILQFQPVIAPENPQSHNSVTVPSTKPTQETKQPLAKTSPTTNSTGKQSKRSVSRSKTKSSSTRPKKKSAAKRKITGVEKHLPTFHKALSNIRRRS